MGSLIAATDPTIRYCGRTATSGNTVVFDWPATEIVFSVTGSREVSIQMDGGCSFFNVVVGREARDPLATVHGERSYIIVSDLNPNDETEVRLYKRTEAVASFPDRKTGPVTVKGIDLDPGGSLVRTQPSHRRVIEVVGDSDTAAYGNLGARTGFDVKDRTVFADPSKQDTAQSWSAFVAEAFDAGCHNISYSGMGAVWNAPGMAADGAMDRHYQRLLVARSDLWVATPEANVLPDVDAIILYIGGNDWWTLAEKGDAPFVDGFVAFVEMIRRLRPTQPLLMLAADPLSGSCLVTRDRQRLFSDDMKRVYGDIASAVGGERQGIYLREVVPEPAIDVEADEDWGLMEHWSVLANHKWARGVIPLVAEVTGWSANP